jgi:hypothetical protein
MHRVASCWVTGHDIDQIRDRGTTGSGCSAWCSITNLVAIGARRRDLGAPVVILWEPSSPEEYFELLIQSGEFAAPLGSLVGIGSAAWLMSYMG